MYATSSPLLQVIGGSGVTCSEVLGEIVDASCLSGEDYAELLKQVVKMSGDSLCLSLTPRFLQLDHLEDFSGPGHPENMYLADCSACVLALSDCLTYSSCTSVYDAKRTLCRPLQMRHPLPLLFGRMNTPCLCPLHPPSGSYQMVIGRNSCDQRAGVGFYASCLH